MENTLLPHLAKKLTSGTVPRMLKVQKINRRRFDLLKSYTLPAELNSAALSPDATTFAVGGTTDNWVRVYDFVSCKEIGI